MATKVQKAEYTAIKKVISEHPRMTNERIGRKFLKVKRSGETVRKVRVTGSWMQFQRLNDEKIRYPEKPRTQEEQRKLFPESLPTAKEAVEAMTEAMTGKKPAVKQQEPATPSMMVLQINPIMTKKDYFVVVPVLIFISFIGSIIALWLVGGGR